VYIGELRSPENLKDTQGLPKDLIPLYQSTLKSNPAQRPTGNFNVQCLGLLSWGPYQSTLKSNPAQRPTGNFNVQCLGLLPWGSYQSTLKSNPAQRPTGNFNVQCLGLLPWGSYQSTLKSNPAQRREGNFESFFCEMVDDFSVQGMTWLSTAHSRRMESGL